MTSSEAYLKIDVAAQVRLDGNGNQAVSSGTPCSQLGSLRSWSTGKALFTLQGSINHTSTRTYDVLLRKVGVHFMSNAYEGLQRVSLRLNIVLAPSVRNPPNGLLRPRTCTLRNIRSALIDFITCANLVEMAFEALWGKSKENVDRLVNSFRCLVTLAVRQYFSKKDVGPIIYQQIESSAFLSHSLVANLLILLFHGVRYVLR